MAKRRRDIPRLSEKHGEEAGSADEEEAADDEIKVGVGWGGLGCMVGCGVGRRADRMCSQQQPPTASGLPRRQGALQVKLLPPLPQGVRAWCVLLECICVRMPMRQVASSHMCVGLTPPLKNHTGEHIAKPAGDKGRGGWAHSVCLANRVHNEEEQEA